MPLTAYRIANHEHAATPLDGEGSFRYGSRWSTKGTRIAFISTTLALAQLEYLGHLFERSDFDPDHPPNLVMVTVEIPDAVAIVAPPLGLPRSWRANPPPVAIARIGDEFAKAGAHCCMRVPSVHAPESASEYNVLVNPGHGDFALITWNRRTFAFEPRLL